MVLKHQKNSGIQELSKQTKPFCAVSLTSISVPPSTPPHMGSDLYLEHCFYIWNFVFSQPRNAQVRQANIMILGSSTLFLNDILITLKPHVDWKQTLSWLITTAVTSEKEIHIPNPITDYITADLQMDTSIPKVSPLLSYKTGGPPYHVHTVSVPLRDGSPSVVLIKRTTLLFGDDCLFLFISKLPLSIMTYWMPFMW